MTASTTNFEAAERAPRRRRETRRARSARDLNAVFAIAWREILRAVKSPLSIAFTVIFPILFIGILGGSISQNLSARPAVRVPAVHAHRDGRQRDVPGHHHRCHQPRRGARQRLHRRAVRRADLALRGPRSGKLIGSGVAAMVSLIGVVAMIVVMQIPMNFGDLLRVIALAPMLALAGGALGVFLIGLTQELARSSRSPSRC